jgi:class 3 adenylate cyclase
MPLFLDIHKLPDGVTPEALHDAHAADVRTQDEYGVCYQAFWYDQAAGTVACLVEGPNREACIEVHRKAHGLVADFIIEVNSTSIQSFMGGATVAPTGDVILPDGARDTGVRILLVTEISNLSAVSSQHGDEAAMKVVQHHDETIHALVHKHGGREVMHAGDGVMLSFRLASAAVQCALEAQQEFAKVKSGIAPTVRIGLAAGEPVSQHEKLFGAVVDQARAICRAAQPGEVLTSASVRDLCAGKGLAFATTPTINAPGLPHPVETTRALGRSDAQATHASASGKADGLRADTVLGGRYILEREIGRGGMATVYAARDSRHDRSVAVKVLRRELAGSIGPDRFLQEIRVAAKLTHPNIVALHDSGDVDGVLYYVMPYLGGDTLRKIVGTEKQLPIPRALEIARRIAIALDHAHRQGVVHRDIKPENIMMLEGEPMILDFGIALALSQAGADRLTLAGLSLGTPTYMSPEQAAGDTAIDVRTDVYALGCVVYEMLAGQPPFTGSNAQALMARVLTEPPPRLSTKRQGIPPHIDAAIHRALEKDPARRFESAGAFAAALS